MTRSVKICKAGKPVKTDTGYTMTLVDIIARDEKIYKRICKKKNLLCLDYEPIEQLRKISDDDFLRYSEVVENEETEDTEDTSDTK